jgi:hypothetical protein
MDGLRAIGAQWLEWQQHVARDREVLARARVDAVLGRAARHDHVERVVAAEQEDADQRLVVGERRSVRGARQRRGQRRSGGAQAGL